MIRGRELVDRMDVAALNEAELLGLMTDQAKAAAHARDAWAELYARHRRYLFVVISRAYGSFLGEDGTVDLVVDTLRRAYEWAGRQPSPIETAARFTGTDPDSTRRRVLGWLAAIAERLFKERFRSGGAARALEKEIRADWEHAPAQEGDAEVSAPNPELAAALADLSEGERDALRLSLPWYDPGSGTFALPRGEAARIAALLDTSPDAVRQRRFRAIRKLTASLQSDYVRQGSV